MPIYNWRCTKCKQEHEATIKLSETDDYDPAEHFSCCDHQELKRYMPSKGAAKFTPTAAWSRHGKKGSW